MQQLDSYLQSPQPGYAILIHGGWGVGKSFMWRSYADQLKGLTPITVSAAGLQNSEELERALFQASIKDIGTEMVREVSTVVGRALLRFAKIDPKDIKLKADATAGKSVVCIDDVERFAGNFDVLFGFVVNLIDDSGVHCVLIADEERAKDNFKGSYGKYKERIIGKSVALQPKLRDFCDQVIKGFVDQSVRECLLEGLDKLVDLIQGAKIENLRTVRFFLTEMDLLLRQLPKDLLGKVFQSQLPSAALFWTAATRLDADNIKLVERPFLNQDFGMALAMRSYNRRRKGQQGKADDESPDDLDTFSELVSELGLAQVSDMWPTSPSFVDHMRGRDGVDYQELAANFQLTLEKNKQDSIAVINHYNRHSDEEVQGAIVEARAEFGNDPITLERLLRIYRGLNYMALRGIFELEPEQWKDEALARLDGLLADPRRVARHAFEIYSASGDTNEAVVLEKCKELAAAVESIERADDRAAALKALYEGNSLVFDATTTPILVGAPDDPRELLSLLRTGGVLAVTRLEEIMRGRVRITNSASFVGVDKDYASKLADCIEAEVILKRPASILDASLHSLSGALRLFVNHIDGQMPVTKASAMEVEELSPNGH